MRDENDMDARALWASAAVANMKTRVSALIVIEEYGINKSSNRDWLDARLTRELLENIFVPAPHFMTVPL